MLEQTTTWEVDPSSEGKSKREGFQREPYPIESAPEPRAYPAVGATDCAMDPHT
jgi:hypothetical protein